jgi:uncharacterized protein VirK/YbjX
LGQQQVSSNPAKTGEPSCGKLPAVPTSALSSLFGGVRADIGRYRPLTVALRLLRRARILGHSAVPKQLSASPSFSVHTYAEGEGDPVFYLSHPHYLTKSLGPKARTAAVTCHYSHEDTAYHPDYFDQVYAGGGLQLWSANSENHRYEIALQPGRDVAYEGGLSVALLMDGGCLCVLSFSLIPSRLLGLPGDLPDTIHLVSRKHQTKDRAYQADYNKAFNRSTPAHMVFAAIEGLVLAQGRHHAIGIDPKFHPSDRPDLNPYFRTGYEDFWTSLGGRSLDGKGYLIDLPMRLSSLDGLEPAKRKRALQRRAHLDAVRQSARARIAALLLPQDGR